MCELLEERHGSSQQTKVCIKASALCPYLFALIMEEFTIYIQEKVPWCMLFADDIVLVDELRISVNTKLER